MGCTGNADGGRAEKEPEPLKAEFEWDYDLTQTVGTACSFETTHFLDRSSGDPSSWLWEFPDGSTSTGQNPTVQSTRTRVVGADGVPDMTVTLTVRNEGETDSTSHEVIAVHC